MPTATITAMANEIASIQWAGRSGRIYDLSEGTLETFVLNPNAFYALVAGSDLLWLGTADDVVGDTTSRACFRTALKMATAVYSMPAPHDELAAMRARFDLEGGHLLLPFAMAG